MEKKNAQIACNFHVWLAYISDQATYIYALIIACELYITRYFYVQLVAQNDQTMCIHTCFDNTVQIWTVVLYWYSFLMLSLLGQERFYGGYVCSKKKIIAKTSIMILIQEILDNNYLNNYNK